MKIKQQKELELQKKNLRLLEREIKNNEKKI